MEDLRFRGFGLIRKVCEYRPLQYYPSFTSLPGSSAAEKAFNLSQHNSQRHLQFIHLPLQNVDPSLAEGLELRSCAASVEGPVEFRQVLVFKTPFPQFVQKANMPPPPPKGFQNEHQKRHHQHHERGRRPTRSGGRTRLSIGGRGESVTPSGGEGFEESLLRRNGSFPDLSRLPPPEYRSLPHPESRAEESKKRKGGSHSRSSDARSSCPGSHASRHIQTETHVHHLHLYHPEQHEHVHFGTVVPYERRLRHDLQRELRNQLDVRKRSKSVSSTSREHQQYERQAQPSGGRYSRQYGHRQPSLSPTATPHMLRPDGEREDQRQQSITPGGQFKGHHGKMVKLPPPPCPSDAYFRQSSKCSISTATASR